MRKRLFLLSIVIVLLALSFPVHANNTRTAKLIEFQGTVSIKKEASEKKIKAFKNMVLSEGDTIYTGEKSKAVLSLDGDKRVTVSAKSTVVLSELSKSVSSTDTAITLKNGGVGSKLDKKLDKSSRYKIKTPTSVMGVRGTEFYVQSSIFEDAVPDLKAKSRDRWRELNSVRAYLNSGILAVSLLSPDNSALANFYDENKASEILMDVPQLLKISEGKYDLMDYTPKGLHREFLDEVKAQIGTLIKSEDFKAAEALEEKKEKTIAREAVRKPDQLIIESDPDTRKEGEVEVGEGGGLMTVSKNVFNLYLYDQRILTPHYYNLLNVTVDYVVNGSMADFSYTHTDGLTYTGSVNLSYVESVDPLPSLALYYSD